MPAEQGKGVSPLPPHIIWPTAFPYREQACLLQKRLGSQIEAQIFFLCVNSEFSRDSPGPSTERKTLPRGNHDGLGTLGARGMAVVDFN